MNHNFNELNKILSMKKVVDKIEQELEQEIKAEQGKTTQINISIDTINVYMGSDDDLFSGIGDNEWR